MFGILFLYGVFFVIFWLGFDNLILRFVRGVCFFFFGVLIIYGFVRSVKKKSVCDFGDCFV